MRVDLTPAELELLCDVLEELQEARPRSQRVRCVREKVVAARLRYRAAIRRLRARNPRPRAVKVPAP
jgi:hypothetical protein